MSKDLAWYLLLASLAASIKFQGLLNLQPSFRVSLFHSASFILVCFISKVDIKCWAFMIPYPQSDPRHLLGYRARESATSSSGMFAARWQDVCTSASAWLWFSKPTFWAVARPCWTASPGRSRPWRPCRRLIFSLKACIPRGTTFPPQVQHLYAFMPCLQQEMKDVTVLYEEQLHLESGKSESNMAF